MGKAVASERAHKAPSFIDIRLKATKQVPEQEMYSGILARGKSIRSRERIVFSIKFAAQCVPFDAFPRRTAHLLLLLIAGYDVMFIYDTVIEQQLAGLIIEGIDSVGRLRDDRRVCI